MPTIVEGEEAREHYAVKYIRRVTQALLTSVFPWGAKPLVEYWVNREIRPIIFKLAEEAEKVGGKIHEREQ